MEIEQFLMPYYENNAGKLHGIVDKILAGFGGISDKDRDDFYSAANEVMASICNTYDKSQDFDGYVYVCLLNKIKTEITRRNREKRRADRMTVSIDMPVEETDGLTIGDLLVSDFDMEKEIFAEVDMENSKIQRFLERLSKMQQKVLMLTADGYKTAEIQKLLQITGKQYTDSMQAIHAYENTKILL